VRPSGAPELEEGDPEAVALANARRKAAACPAADGELVLGVDTLVALDGRIYGKPAAAADAAATLRALSGRTHEVVSGLVAGDREAVAVTEVTFRVLDDAWIDWYVGTGEWKERAGGYAIQGRGAALVRGIRGDYLNVVGLPVSALIDVLPGLLAGH
jgi:septum formation protein